MFSIHIVHACDKVCMSHYERWKISGSTCCISEDVLMHRKRVAGVRRYNKVTVRMKRSSLKVLSRQVRHLIRQRFQPAGLYAGG